MFSKVDFKVIFHIVSILLIIESFFMITAFPVCLYYDSYNIVIWLISFVVTLLVGFGLFILTRKYEKNNVGIKEGFLIVSLAWIIISLFGTLPFVLSHAIPGFINAFFESTSGFSTTGSSILSDIEILPKSILYWRSLTHWIGGIGIVVLAIAILPFLKANAIYLFNSESSLSGDDKFKPRIKDVAQRLFVIYVSLTIFETILLIFQGMPLFDAICHSFGTIATGGYSTKNTSIGSYSPSIQYTVALFMLISGINFNLHYLAITRNFKNIFSNEELRYYLLIILVATAIITFILITKNSYGVEAAFRSSFFQVVSIITCTGFATDDFLLWAPFAWHIIFLLMFIGASMGSTGGGIKVARHVVMFKYVYMRIRKTVSPNAIIPIRYNNNIVKEESAISIITFIFLYISIFMAGSLLMTGFGMDIQTAMGSVITTMGGIGPGIGAVGPASNFSALPDISKLFLCGFMLLGRLEIYSLLVIFTPRFWKD